MESSGMYLEGVQNLKALPILVTGETSPSKIRSASISSMSTELEDDAIFRKRWKSTYGFVLACIHLSLGLGNIWRFPYIAYRHGGGSFVVAYLIITVIIIVPLFFLETSLGQFSSRGPLAIWVISPGFKGIGYAMLIISTLASMYFNMINSYSVLYTFASLQENLPWERCTNWWNTKDCVSIHFLRDNNPNISLDHFESTVLKPDRKWVDDKGFLRYCVPSYPLDDINRTTLVPSRPRFHSKIKSAVKLFGADTAAILASAKAKDRSSEANSGRRNYVKPEEGDGGSRGPIKVDQSANAVRGVVSTNGEEAEDRDDDFLEENVTSSSSPSINAFIPTLSTEQYLSVMLGEPPTSFSIGITWQLALGSLFVWIIVFGVLIKGHKFSGKVAYLACLYPFVLFTIIFARVQSLTGSRPGLIKFFMPDRRILTAEVWHDAVVQSFFSNYVCWGPIIMMASHNSFFNNLLRDSIVVPCINTVAALMAGCIVFALISYLSLNTCIPFEQMAPKDPSLIYVIYPVITSTFPLSPLWGFLIFATMSQLGINSQIFCVKTLITSIMDEKIPHFTKPLRIIFYTVIVLFLVGLIFATKKGVYLIEFIDFETTAWSLLTIAILECVIISWVYGSNHLLLDVRIILRRPLRPLWYTAWSYVTPAALIAIMVVSVLDNRDIILPYPRGYRRSAWVTAIAWCLSILPLLVICGYFAYAFASVDPPLWRRREQGRFFSWFRRNRVDVKGGKLPKIFEHPSLTPENSDGVDAAEKGEASNKEDKSIHFFPFIFDHGIKHDGSSGGKSFFSKKIDSALGSFKPSPKPPKSAIGHSSVSSIQSDSVVFKESKKKRSHIHDPAQSGRIESSSSGRHRRLFFNKNRTRLGIKKDITTQLVTVTVKERLLKCLRATPLWGPYTENHQLLQQIAFRIQRCNHQILNKAVHKKAREIIDLVNRSGSTNLCIKDLLFINPDATTTQNGEARLENIEDIEAAAKLKPPRKYSLFDGFKEVVFMELPKDQMTKIDEPGVYSFLQPLDIDIPSNMVLLPNAYSFPTQNDSRTMHSKQDDGAFRYNYPRYMSQDFTPDFPKLSNLAESNENGEGSGPSSAPPYWLPQKQEQPFVDQSVKGDTVLSEVNDNEQKKNKVYDMWRKLKLRALAQNALLTQNFGPRWEEDPVQVTTVASADKSHHSIMVTADKDRNKPRSRLGSVHFPDQDAVNQVINEEISEVSDYPMHKFVFQRSLDPDLYQTVIKSRRNSAINPPALSQSSDLLDPNLYPGDVPYRPPDWNIFGDGEPKWHEKPALLSRQSSVALSPNTFGLNIEYNSPRRNTLSPDLVTTKEPTTTTTREKVKKARSPSLETASGMRNEAIESKGEKKIVLGPVKPRNKVSVIKTMESEQEKDPLEYQLEPDIHISDVEEEGNAT